ncbi:MAG: lysophospholipid acyltransferase family protein [Bacteroidales bacterium]
MSFRITPLNLVFAFYLLLMALLTPLWLLTAVPVRIFGGADRTDRYFARLARFYSRHLFFVFRVKVDIRGLENVPESDRVCFISNHQGLADIPLIVGYIPKTVGFIAKKELGNIPVLNIWMRALGCVLIDRQNLRSSVGTIERGIRQIKKGHPMVIFPEGTRSRKHQMRPFKPGSFKLVTGADAWAVPVSISGTYKLIEETGELNPTRIRLTIHPAIDVSQLTEEEKETLYKRVESTVRSGI